MRTLLSAMTEDVAARFLPDLRGAYDQSRGSSTARERAKKCQARGGGRAWRGGSDAGSVRLGELVLQVVNALLEVLQPLLEVRLVAEVLELLAGQQAERALQLLGQLVAVQAEDRAVAVLLLVEERRQVELRAVAPLQGRRHRLHLAGAPDLERRLGAVLAGADAAAQVEAGVDRLAAHGGDDVAHLEAGLLGPAPRLPLGG